MFNVVWNIFNGKKRNIAIVLLLLAQICKQFGLVVPDNAEEIINQVLAVSSSVVGVVVLIIEALKKAGVKTVK